jgi:hypothetical protein
MINRTIQTKCATMNETTSQPIEPTQQCNPRNHEKRLRRNAQKAAAKEHLEAFKKTAGLLCAVTRCTLHDGGDRPAAMMAGAMLHSFIEIAFTAADGAVNSSSSHCMKLAKIRAANLVNDEQFFAIAQALRLLEGGYNVASAGNALVAIESVSVEVTPLEGQTPDQLKRNFKRRQQSEGEAALRNYNPNPMEAISRERLAEMSTTIQPGMRHRLLIAWSDSEAHQMDAGGEFDDSQEGLRALAAAAVGLHGKIPEGRRLIVSSREPWTGDDEATEAGEVVQ